MGYPKKGKYHQGVYYPINKNKYKGGTDPVYRSMLERKFFYYFDTNPNVLAWASESVVVPYFGTVDKKVHRYYIDLIAAIKQPDGTTCKYLIEVKPYAQTMKPTSSKKKKKSTMLYENIMYSKNQDKWSAANAYAEKKGMKFVVLTEKYLPS